VSAREGPIWSRAPAAAVPAGDAWLGPPERQVLAGLHVVKRRDDWRLGRLVAKHLVAARTGIPWTEVEILAAPDGAPEPWHGEERLPWSLSFSHRAGWAAAALSPAPMVVGCDLELVEPRSDAFVAEWLAPPEQALVRAAPDARSQAVLANLVWTGKEAAAKVLREGLRLEVRRTVVSVPGGLDAVVGEVDHPTGTWLPIEVHCHHEQVGYRGFWRLDDDLVLTVLSEPAATDPPRLVGDDRRSSRVALDLRTKPADEA